jgi:hypothetical protein
MVHEYRGQRFEGRVTEAELDVLVPLVSDARTIEELRKAPGCPPAIHATEIAVVEIVPGIFVSGDISGCIEGPLAAFRYHLHAVTKRLFPQSPFAIGLVVVLPTPGPRFRLSELPVFGGFSLHRQWGPCAPSAVCAERLGVTPTEKHVLQLGGNPRGEWRGVVDFEPLSSVAVSPRVIAELRKPAPCPAVTDVLETMEVIIGPGMYIRGSTAGCSEGPVAELRAAARALVVRLSGNGGADAGAADHPADGLAP